MQVYILSVTHIGVILIKDIYIYNWNELYIDEYFMNYDIWSFSNGMLL